MSACAAPTEAPRVVVLRPFMVMSRASYSAPVTPPIGPAYLSAVLEQAGYRVSMIDAVAEAIHQLRASDCGRFNLQGLRVEEIVERIPEDAAILGVSLMFSQEWPMHRELILAVRAKRPDLVIVVGGEHPSALPEFVLNDCPAVDHLVTGEGELPFLHLVHALYTGGDIGRIPGVWTRDADGVPVVSARPERLASLAGLPRPAWHLIPVQAYFLDNWTMGIAMGRNMPVVATRGCPYRCAFCSSATMWTTRYVMRSPAEVVDEIEWLMREYGANSFDFLDLTAIVRKRWTLDFCDEITRRGLDITWQLPSGTRSEALDAECLAALKRAGCRFLVYAPESGSERTLKAISKKISLENIERSIRQAVALGITVKINLIIGFPDETTQDVLATLRFALRMALAGVHDCNISLFSCYPGSAIYRGLRERGMAPPPGDAYFHELIAQFDMTQKTTTCAQVPGGVLAGVRMAGHALFYGLAYLSRPGRILSLAARLGKEGFRASNLFEQRLSDMFARMRMRRSHKSKERHP
ncbi:B12-binding domain-containing radical SAM protein [Fundidesulfovibrio magnetotacticus]|nr:radical SAM protein [Fundidesulfovibrio magnetotacticus]